MEKLKIPLRKPKASLSNTCCLIYGPPKIGKSTLASQFPGALFLATEEGLDWIPSYSISIIDWDSTEMHVGDDGRVVSSFIGVCAYLNNEKPKNIPGTNVPLKTIVIDVVDLAYEMCFQHVCEISGMAYPTDLEYGRGWKLVRNEWQRVVTRMSKWPQSLLFISHSKTETIESQAVKRDRVIPSITGQGSKDVLALCDLVLYCYMGEHAELDADGKLTGEITEQRLIRCKPQNSVVAGDRTGRLPAEIPMNYDELVKYFPDTGKE
jgi:hypothetical protein